MRSGEVRNSLRVFDNPDSFISIGNKDGSLGFPFRVSHRSASTPTFLHAIRTASLRMFVPTSLVADPSVCGGASERSATRPQTNKKTKIIQLLIMLTSLWFDHDCQRFRNKYHEC